LKTAAVEPSLRQLFWDFMESVFLC
jgi:hypothetical protein